MQQTERAFTLVELSIVLVILGLLIGGVLTGQSLIRASELRSITTQEAQFVTAVQTFRDKYFGIPGDITNGTAYWGYAGGGSCTNSSGTANTSPGTCDGNGDGMASSNGTLGETSENLQFWRQLALSGLIEGNYTGKSVVGDSGCGVNSTFGTNAPRAKVSSTGWLAGNLGNHAGESAGTGSIPAGNYGNVLVYSALSLCYAKGTAALKAEEAYNIDTKLDDGKPITGRVMTNWTNPFPANCTNAASRTDTTGTYKLDQTAIACALYFTNAY